MANNYDDYGYENENNSSGLSKKILIIVLILIAIVIVFFLIKSCNKGNSGGGNVDKPEVFNYEKTLLDAGKLYYENNNDEIPSSNGRCNQINLQILIDKGLVNPTNFSSCSVENTYIRVCRLEDGKLHYMPWLSCSDKNSDSEYGDLAEGSLSDVVADSSYIEFKFMPQALKTSSNTELGSVEELWKDDIKYTSYKTLSTTNYYRFRDKLFTWDVVKNTYYSSTGTSSKASDIKEYYTTAPNSEYKLKDEDTKTTEAYKWYTVESNKVYALGDNGAKAFSKNPIEGYPYKDGAVEVKYYRYRTREVVRTYAPTLYYSCSSSADSDIIVNQRGVECGKGYNTSYTVNRGTFYSCVEEGDNTSSAAANKVSSANVTCKVYGNYGEWSSLETTACKTTDTIDCQSATTYYYNWYKIVEEGPRTYYPSKASEAKGESVYYTEAPVKGAIMDIDTKTTAYKWYKSTKSTTSEYSAVAPSGYASATKTNVSKWSEWTDWSTKNPKINDGRIRNIETKTKIKLQQILETNSSSEYEDLSDEYVDETEMINIFNNKGYKVSSLTDINNNGEIRYQIKMYLRNKKETK